MLPMEAMAIRTPDPPRPGATRRAPGERLAPRMRRLISATRCGTRQHPPWTNESRGHRCPRWARLFANSGPGISPGPVVEVAGIEPASYDASPGLLRAQSAVSLLGPTDRTDKPV